MERYSFTVINEEFLAGGKNLNYHVEQYQDKGWEVCGETLLYEKNGRVYQNVPMRKAMPDIQKFEPPKQLLEVAAELWKLNPSTLLTGSLMLALSGVYVGREPSDVDLRITNLKALIVVPEGAEILHNGVSEYTDGENTRLSFRYKGVKVDFLYNTGLDNRGTSVSRGDCKAMLASVESLLEMKGRYAKQNNSASEKHRADIELINKQYGTIEKSY